MHLDIKCSSLSSLQVSWVEAESTCVSYGGHLASINSDDDSIFLGSSVAAGNDVWIGAFSRKIDEWVWSDDTEWGYEQWKVRIEKMTVCSQHSNPLVPMSMSMSKGSSGNNLCLLLF